MVCACAPTKWFQSNSKMHGFNLECNWNRVYVRFLFFIVVGTFKIWIHNWSICLTNHYLIHSCTCSHLLLNLPVISNLHEIFIELFFFHHEIALPVSIISMDLFFFLVPKTKCNNFCGLIHFTNEILGGFFFSHFTICSPLKVPAVHLKCNLIGKETRQFPRRQLSA